MPPRGDAVPRALYLLSAAIVVSLALQERADAEPHFQAGYVQASWRDDPNGAGWSRRGVVGSNAWQPDYRNPYEPEHGLGAHGGVYDDGLYDDDDDAGE